MVTKMTDAKKNMTERKLTTIELGQAIPFTCRDDKYGRAEFIVCPVFKRGIMRELYIDPKQQPQYFEEWFKVDLVDIRIKTLSLSGYLLGRDPRVWHSFWCKTHKCFSLELYVANDTSSLTVVTHFGDNVTLEFR
jgi:hypothetical protein